MSRLRRLRRWWPVLPVAFAVLVVYAAWPGRWTFTVSPETTYVTEPLDADGFVDYPTALNRRLGQGVTAETNANVLIWQALGPHPEGATLPPEYFQWLGSPQPPEQGEYFIDSDKYFDAHLKDQPEEPDGQPERKPAEPPGPGLPGDDELGELRLPPDRKTEWQDLMDRARKWPWKAKEQPDVADWLKRNEKPLAVAIEASRRPHYFNPLVSKNPTPQSARLINCLLPSVQKCRAVAAALACRAMGKVGDGDFDGAWQDLLACQRLGRLMARSGTLIETLVGLAIVAIATDGQLTLLSHSKRPSKQLLAWLDDLRKLPPFPPMADKMDLGERFMTLDALMSITCHGPQFLEALDGRPGGAQSNDPLGRLFTASIDFDPAFRNVNRTFDRCGAACRLPERAARRQEFKQIEDDVRSLKQTITNISVLDRVTMSKAERGEMIGNIMITLFLPAMEKVLDAIDRMEQTQINLHVAFALAAYRADTGRYPARLDELAPRYLAKVPGDMFSGGPLVYRPDGNGYLLYSVGVNGQDDEGRWTDDEPRGDDPRVRMPVPEPVKK